MSKERLLLALIAFT